MQLLTMSSFTTTKKYSHVLFMQCLLFQCIDCSDSSGGESLHSKGGKFTVLFPPMHFFFGSEQNWFLGEATETSM